MAKATLEFNMVAEFDLETNAVGVSGSFNLDLPGEEQEQEPELDAEPPRVSAALIPVPQSFDEMLTELFQALEQKALKRDIHRPGQRIPFPFGPQFRQFPSF